ncbi:B-cell receptor CD22-like isoform X1, partial [Clarias magur]
MSALSTHFSVAEVVVSQPEWGVYYTRSYICGLKGSTVTMGCSYTYPHGYTVQRGFWSRELATDKEPPDLSLDPKYRGRVQYLGYTPGDCKLSLSGVTEQDQGKYYFSFITTYGGKYQGKDGVYLSVSELQVEMIPGSVIEGRDVTLTCKTTCSLTVTPTVTWYKTGSPSSFISSCNPLRLQSVSQRDAGSYSCAVQGESYRSPAVTLDVQ